MNELFVPHLYFISLVLKVGFFSCKILLNFEEKKSETYYNLIIKPLDFHQHILKKKNANYPLFIG